MKSYLSFIERFKWPLLGLIISLVLALSLKITSLQFDGSYRIWFARDSVILKEYDQFCATFGNDDSVLIVFSDPEGIVRPQPLQSIERLTKALKKFSAISHVNSILNYQYIYANPKDQDDIIVENFIQDPSDAASLRERRKIALDDPMIRDFMISRDGTTTMIAARLSSFARMDKEVSIELVNNIKNILKEESMRTGYKYYISGAPVNDAALATIADHDSMIYMPIAFVIITIVLYLFFRTLWGVFIPIITVVLASIITLSFYALMGLELNNFSINIPIFITAIGIADAVHFYTAWVALRYSGYNNKDAIAQTFKKNFQPMLLTTLTTSIGFGSLISSDIVPLSTLGLTIALGSITALILILFLMPVILLFLKEDYMPAPIKTVRCWVRELRYAYFVIHHDWMIVTVALSVAIVVGWGVIYTKFDSNSIKYFDTDVDISKAAYYTMEKITGPATYEVIIDTKQNDGIKSPEFLKKVEKFDKEIKEEFPEVRFTSSLFDVLKRFQDVMNPSHPQDEIVGASQEINAQYLLIYSLSLPQGMEINDKMDIKQSKLRFSVQADIVNSSRSLEIIKWCEEWWKQNGLSAKVEGQVSLFAQMQHMVSQTLFNSLMLAFITIGVLIFFIIRNVRLMIIFLIPNLLPLVMSIGFMGWMGIPIDVGIAVAAVIVLGLAVDDTIYFFNKYSEARKYNLGAAQTFDYILEHSGSAMVFTTVILSSAFSVFLLSDFMPNVHFALMTISTMFLALLADLLLTPALISVMSKK